MKNTIFGSCVALSTTVMVGCTADLQSGIDQTKSSLECSEFTNSGTIDASLDVHVKAFLEATTEFKNVSADVRTQIRDACAHIALDLGANDTWSAAGDDDKAIWNDQKTGACNAAQSRIDAIMTANASANFSLAITPGYCREDFEEYKKCDTKCSQDKSCDSGAVETRCDPAQLSVICEGNCSANAQCEGSVTVAANCNGKCDARCDGACKGTCFAEDGTSTEDAAECHGKCDGSCTGQCTGTCTIQVEEGIACGANVHCKGGCSTQFTDGKCETECSPPKCTVDTHCYDVCTTQVEAKTVCEPTHVEVTADLKVSADVGKLVTTLNKNLPTVVDTARVRGKLVQDAAGRLVAAGKAVLNARASLDIKSQGCAAAGAEASAVAAATLDTSVNGGAAVSNSCTSHAH